MPNDQNETTGWRALLVRYMAKIIDRESVTLAESASPIIALSADDLAALAELEPEARRLADGQAEDVKPITLRVEGQRDNLIRNPRPPGPSEGPAKVSKPA